MKNLLVIGHGRHGKDTVCEILQMYHGFKFISSSEFACDRAVYPNFTRAMLAGNPNVMAPNQLAYDSPEECFENRAANRDIWYNLIKAYNLNDPSRLAREMLEEGYNIYCGMRDNIELEASRELFDEIWWVDRSKHLPTEPETSMKIKYDPDSMKLINNNDGLRELWFRVDRAVWQGYWFV